MTTERIEAFYRDATAADVARVMNNVGEKVEARFRDGSQERWIDGLHLSGWHLDGSFPWLDENRSGWKVCQVYDPPQYWLEKPEPGEGYRLLGKFPDEDLQPGDEAFDLRGDGKWESSHNLAAGFQQQSEAVWYRRRINPPKPEPKHYKLNAWDTADLPSGHRIIVTDHGIEVQ